MQNDVAYRPIALEEIKDGLLNDFVRHQVVTSVWRKLDGRWRTVEQPFVDDWTDADRKRKLASFRVIAASGGYLVGAFANGQLKGFAAVERQILGSRRQYAELSLLHVSEDMRGKGIGKRLFSLAAEYARIRGIERLYISAHSAVESQAFYRAMGCVEAEEYSEYHVEKEPYDCQLEYKLSAAEANTMICGQGGNGLELRELNRGQTDLITEAFLDIFTKEPWNDDWGTGELLQSHLLDLIGNANSLPLGLFDGETLIGISLGSVRHWTGGAQYWIDEFGIRPQWQGSGMGTAFLRLIEERIRADGMKAILLMTDRNVPAYRFYQKNGFQEERDTALLIKKG